MPAGQIQEAVDGGTDLLCVGRAGVGRRVSPKDMLLYASGDGLTSLVMNTFVSFSMLYYTKALGLNAAAAGVAMAVVTLWDAFVAPIAGHYTDRTRSRYGRRHPYLLLGGLLTIVCYYAAWSVPKGLLAPGWLLVYLVGVTLLLRTASAVYSVAQTALGFEICRDYEQRSTLQGVRNSLYMVVNLGASLVVWNVFLRGREGVEGTSIASNYQRMAVAFAAVGMLFAVCGIWGTRKHIVDTRSSARPAPDGISAILRSLWAPLADPYARRILLFMGLFYVGIMLVSSVQMFVYVDFMQFSGWQRSIVHGSTMVAAALGGLLAAPMVHWMDKKPAVFAGVLIGVVANISIVLLFYTGWVAPGVELGVIPVAMLVLLLCNSGFHLAINLAKVTAYSMIADLSEVNQSRTGILKDGAYTATLLCFIKIGMSAGLCLSGVLMVLIGYTPEVFNPPEVTHRLLPVGFLGGAVLALLALLPIWRYPINRAYMDRLKQTGPTCR